MSVADYLERTRQTHARLSLARFHSESPDPLIDVGRTTGVLLIVVQHDLPVAEV